MSGKILNFIKSDDLLPLIKLAEQFAIVNNKAFFTFSLIVDANIIVKDIKYLLTKVTGANVRTAFLEMLEVKAITCFAPTYLQVEMRKKLAELSAKYHFSEQEGMILWERFSNNITFIDAGGPEDAPHDIQDPKDWSYIMLQRQIKQPIITHDSDIADMGGFVVNPNIISPLRDYARESAKVLTVKIGANLAVVIPMHLVIKVAVCVMQWLNNNKKQALPIVGAAALLLFYGLMMYPEFRAFIKLKCQVLIKGLKASGQALTPLVEEFNESKSKADKAKNTVIYAINTK